MRKNKVSSAYPTDHTSKKLKANDGARNDLLAGRNIIARKRQERKER